MYNDLDKYPLGGFEMRLLFQAISIEANQLFMRLESEIPDLEILRYFEKYYHNLFHLVTNMKNDYPDFDMSIRDIDELYRRKHMND
jgi:hypothetical protein